MRAKDLIEPIFTGLGISLVIVILISFLMYLTGILTVNITSRPIPQKTSIDQSITVPMPKAFP
jgi:hypothetical protein